MANYQYSSKSLHLPCKTLSLVLFFVYLLLVGPCVAIRTGQTMSLNERREVQLLKGKHNQPSFPYQSMVFNFFPKGPVPPSGPSKRHNAVVDSTPPN
ncbi:hypothetical protein Fmac_001490 [Flemingia macrophylla]|uniref:Uncharacterized protein n=1 Tax=Flemingia macrophylla TaxID=520843 RepID=A0ABD1NH85_9FABA